MQINIDCGIGISAFLFGCDLVLWELGLPGNVTRQSTSYMTLKKNSW